MKIGYPLNKNSKSLKIRFSNPFKSYDLKSIQSPKMRIGYDVVGNIAILKFDRDASASVKKKFAVDYLRTHKGVSTVVEKIGKFSGRLRTLKTKWLAGAKTREALYRENGCEFRFNIDTSYFSPRLSEERKNIAGFVKKGERVLVMFGGVAPFAIVIGKHLNQLNKSNPPHPPRDTLEVISVELGKEPSKYALENVKRNKLVDVVKVVQGDVGRVIGAGKKVSGVFDRIVMARPNLEDSFLDVAFRVVKRGTIVHYYGFYLESEIGLLRSLITDEALKAGKKVKILRVVKAGDIGAKKWRYRADIKIN